MTRIAPGSQAWLDQVREDIIDPQRPIIDPHHHLWQGGRFPDYMLDELWQDTGSGHNIVKTVYMECFSFYDMELPRHLQPTGESATVADIARQSRGVHNRPFIAGLVARAELSLAGESEELLRETLARHREVAGALFKGIRDAGAHDRNSAGFFIQPRPKPYVYGRESFRKGLRILAELGLTYDTWHYHHQNEDFLELAQAVPECTMVLDHFGTPLGVGVYRGCRDEIFQQWKQDVRAIARCPNVYAKLGGMAMPDNGFDWHTAPRPPTSDEFVARQARYYLHMIDCFGPQRCMFESNFPVDRNSLSYHVLWNGLKKIASRYSPQEQQAMFHDTAEKVYRLTDQ